MADSQLYVRRPFLACDASDKTAVFPYHLEGIWVRAYRGLSPGDTAGIHNHCLRSLRVWSSPTPTRTCGSWADAITARISLADSRIYVALWLLCIPSSREYHPLAQSNL